MISSPFDGNVLILKLDHAPLNTFSLPLRRMLYQKLHQHYDDTSVKSIVLAGSGRCFSAGADVSEFGEGRLAAVHPSLLDIITLMDSYPKPIVAAVHGVCFGGAFEVILACHYRLGHRGCLLAFPEVKLGILPAATGTQKLPRLVGIPSALDIICSGRQIKATEALDLGILDDLVTDDVVQASVLFAEKIHNEPLPSNRYIRNTSVATDPEVARFAYEQALVKIKARTPGLIAPLLCAQSVMNSYQAFEKGLRIENRLANVLFSSSQAKGLQHIFFAERQASKWSVRHELDYTIGQSAIVETIGVVGGGLMGSGIVIAFLNAGFPVTLVEHDEQGLIAAKKRIMDVYNIALKRERMSENAVKTRLAQLILTTNFNRLSTVDLVVEAVFEAIHVKKGVFEKLDQVCKTECILATNTSTLDIDCIAGFTARPDRVIGMHYFVPASVTKLLEVVHGLKTSSTTIHTAMQIGKRLNKIAVLVANGSNGFCGNRIIGRFWSEVDFLIQEGCTPWEIDEVMENFGFPIGPCKVRDLTGFEVSYLVRQAMKDKFMPLTDSGFIHGEETCELVEFLYENGRNGRKNGRGWYTYNPHDPRRPLIDPSVMELVGDYCRQRGVIRKRIPPFEIEERCLLSLINEGFKCFEDGIVSKLSDVDVVLVHGYGFPPQTGGPMLFAEMFGYGRLLRKLRDYSKRFPFRMHWVPSRYLEGTLSKSNAMHISSRF